MPLFDENTKQPPALNLAELCGKTLDLVVSNEVKNPVYLQIYRQFRPGLMGLLKERLPGPCQE